MRVVLILVILIGALGCSKYTTPRKVNRKLTDGTWLINEFIENEKSLMSKYKNITMAFGEDGTLNVTTGSKIVGKWYAGADRTPAVVYIELPETDSLHVIADDWIVYELNKTKCVLKRRQGADDEDFDYDKFLDNLTLYKK